VAKLIHLRMDEAVGSTTLANSGAVAGNFLVSTNTPTLGASGILLNGVDTIGDATRRYLKGDPAVFNAVQPESFTAWVWFKQRTVSATTVHLFHKVYSPGTYWGSPPASIWAQLQAGTTSLAFGVLRSGSTAGGSGTTAPLNAWHMLAITYNAITGDAGMYLDGQQTSSFSYPGAPSKVIDYGTSGLWMIGSPNDDSASPEPFDGLFDEFQVHDYAFSAGSIRSEYYQTSGLFHTLYISSVVAHPTARGALRLTYRRLR
jgi:hypothetical protein